MALKLLIHQETRWKNKILAKNCLNDPFNRKTHA